MRRVQEQQDGKKGSPLGSRALRAHEHVTNNQSAAGVQTALEFTQQGSVFRDAVSVENVREKYGIEPLRQRIT